MSVVQRQYRTNPQSIEICSAFVRSVIERLSDPNISPQVIIWQDIAATQLRREWRKQIIDTTENSNNQLVDIIHWFYRPQAS